MPISNPAVTTTIANNVPEAELGSDNIGIGGIVVQSNDLDDTGGVVLTIQDKDEIGVSG